MSTYTIKHSCGHEEEIYLSGSYKSNQYKIEKMEDELCIDCKKAKLEKEAEEMGCLPLSGTTKQVVWAMEIRADVLKDLDKFTVCIKELIAQKKADDSWFTPINKAIQYIKTRKSATYFIDNRNNKFVYPCTTYSAQYFNNAFVHLKKYADAYDAEQ